MQKFKSFSSAETKKFAEQFASRVTRHGSRQGKGALVIALVGELGSGKTTFVQGFLRGLGVRKRAASPTFILFRRFALRHPPARFAPRSKVGGHFVSIYHVDAYRIKKPQELLTLGFRDILADPQNLVLVEWADRVRWLLPKSTSWILFKHGKNEKERIIETKTAARR